MAADLVDALVDCFEALGLPLGQPPGAAYKEAPQPTFGG
jgi:hypothetical protein